MKTHIQERDTNKRTNRTSDRDREREKKQLFVFALLKLPE